MRFGGGTSSTTWTLLIDWPITTSPRTANQQSKTSVGIVFDAANWFNKGRHLGVEQTNIKPASYVIDIDVNNAEV